MLSHPQSRKVQLFRVTAAAYIRGADFCKGTVQGRVEVLIDKGRCVFTIQADSIALLPCYSPGIAKSSRISCSGRQARDRKRGDDHDTDDERNEPDEIPDERDGPFLFIVPAMVSRQKMVWDIQEIAALGVKKSRDHGPPGAGLYPLIPVPDCRNGQDTGNRGFYRRYVQEVVQGSKLAACDCRIQWFLEGFCTVPREFPEIPCPCCTGRGRNFRVWHR